MPADEDKHLYGELSHNGTRFPAGKQTGEGKSPHSAVIFGQGKSIIGSDLFPEAKAVDADAETGRLDCEAYL